MKDHAKDQTENVRLAARGKRTGPDEKKQTGGARPVFIDLDDAYGVPFSAAASVQTYGEGRKKQP